jgi:DNA processing protein
MNIVTISKTNKNYPQRLANLHQPPKKIYQKGADIAELLKRPGVGIVGSRKVSGYGRMATKNLASSLARKHIVIISGLALGVDSIGHQSAVEAGGKTVAVLPSGIEKIYPASHFQLADKIVQTGGALLSEYTGKEPPMRHNFIERNRLIAALADVLLITEAAERSGSLHTAKFALELGKTVAAVPGDIYRPTSVGCNNLIKMGAQPVTSEQDIIELLGLSGEQLSLTESYYPENKAEKAVIDLMGKGISDGFELAAKSGLDTGQFQQTLTMLEIKDVIAAAGNNRWRMK